jgi:hypothetical protein
MVSGPFWTKGLDPDAPIYRIHPKRYLKSLLAGKLHLPATYRWADPFENLLALASYVVRTPEGQLETKFLEGGRLPTFGQCWTTIPESDAMWRIYSRVQNTKKVNHTFFPDEGVRLRTTVRKLVNCLADGMGVANRNNCYITAVKYFSESDLTQYVANAIGTYREKAFGGVTGHADGLSLKRDPFRHESEVRLLYIDAGRRFEGQPSIEVPIDVNAVIEEITLDPRTRTGGGEPKRKAWLEKHGFKNPVNTSLLYLRVMMQVPLL